MLDNRHPLLAVVYSTVTALALLRFDDIVSARALQMLVGRLAVVGFLFLRFRRTGTADMLGGGGGTWSSRGRRGSAGFQKCRRRWDGDGISHMGHHRTTELRDENDKGVGLSRRRIVSTC